MIAKRNFNPVPSRFSPQLLTFPPTFINYGKIHADSKVSDLTTKVMESESKRKCLKSKY